MKSSRFARYAWTVLAVNIGIILWGAYVRASGSGAGCGSHWPLCNGQVIPRAPAIETVVELSHRLTSGIGLLMVVGLFVWARRGYERGHRVRTGAALTLFFMVTEALVGAGLVLFSLVADNASIARALFMSVHLANTFLLLGALTLTAWWSSGGSPIYLRGQGTVLWLLLLACLATILLGVSGAVTALGDTLFPSRSLADGLKEDFSSTAHFLIRLRIFHPAIAIGVGLFLLVVGGVTRTVRRSPATERFARLLFGLFLLQLAVGALNVVLLAPILMQIIHLLLADAVWITLVLLTVAALAVRPALSSAGVPSLLPRQ
ncbi:MAG TPA: COX15/CtaA family protein [Herpetosiphonaceae bacterium]|nr:COX15/CtaA family protein [Herpetosiphonaceae bacterium]